MNMSRIYSLAYLTSNTLTPPEAVRLAGELGYAHVGLRLLPNAAGAPRRLRMASREPITNTMTVNAYGSICKKKPR